MRYLFPTDGQRIIFAWDAGGYLHSRPGLSFTVYSDPAGTQPVTDLLAPDGSDLLPSTMTIPSGDPARIPQFLGPDGVTDLYLLAIGSTGPTYPITANLGARVAALEAQIQALSSTLSPDAMEDLMAYTSTTAATAATLASLSRRVLGPVIQQSASFTAADTGNYEISGSATVVITPPASPQVGDVFAVKISAAYTGGGVSMTGTEDGISGFTFSTTTAQENIFTYDGTGLIVS